MKETPKHYQGLVEPIHLMEEQLSPQAFIGFLQGNLIKYAARLGKKDDIRQEAKKILEYANWLNKAVNGQKI